MQKKSVFLIVAIKPLSDGTFGFRYNLFGNKGLVRLRKKSKGFNSYIGKNQTFKIRNLGKIYFARELKKPARRLHHFAG